MTSEKRKIQLKEAQKRVRAKKKEAGYKGFYCQILPEWRKAIMDFIRGLESNNK